MPSRYHQLRSLIDAAKPSSIVEIGTHAGARAGMMCLQALRYKEKVHYTGYDLFDDASDETNEAEMNGKGGAPITMARNLLDDIAKYHPQFSYELIKGNTRETLHGKEVVADFVFIDGGHSVETIRGDFEAVKYSDVVVFDDYYVAGADTEKFGCNAVVKDIPHRVLEHEDKFGDLAVRMVVRT
jgi:predicted O-methyltransferase YrrM